MEKEDYRKYLENISDYLNVWSICSLYNEKYPSEKIDYTNLKNFVNKKMYEKISIKRLENLTFFIKQNVGMDLILENNNEKNLKRQGRWSAFIHQGSYRVVGVKCFHALLQENKHHVRKSLCPD